MFLLDSFGLEKGALLRLKNIFARKKRGTENYIQYHVVNHNEK